MKASNPLPFLSVALVAFGLTMSARALPAYEPFNYPPGVILPGQTNPDGLTWAAAGPAGPNISVITGNLSVTGLMPPAGNRIQVSPVIGPSGRFPLGGAYSNDTFYFSFALRVNDVAGLGEGFFAGFNPGVGGAAQTPTNLAPRVALRAVAGGYRVGMAKNSSNPADYVWDAVTYTTNDTVFLVGSYAYVGGGGANDEARLWVNPPAATFGAAAAPGGPLFSTIGPDLPQIQSWVQLQRPAPLQPASMLVDELRVGFSWAFVTPPAPPPSFDWGDAPNTYATTRAANGPRHVITGLRLGASVDAETNGLPSATATGDDVDGTADEDGAAFAYPYYIGSPATVNVTASAAGRLDAFVDFNRNGSFADAGEQVALSLPVVAGANPVTFVIPATASAGATFARFRLSTVGGLSFDGPAADGEVEDHLINLSSIPVISTTIRITPPVLFAGERMAVSLNVTNTGSSLANDVTVSNLFPAGVSFVGASGAPLGCVGSNETVVCYLGSLQPGGGVSLSLTGVADRVVFQNAESIEGKNQVAVFARGVIVPLNLSNILVTLFQYLDFGDAPTTYPVTRAEDGARHSYVTNWYLGSRWDRETNGQHSAGSTWDDTDGLDDEDGVAVFGQWTAGQTAYVTVRASTNGFLDAWVDFSRNGNWVDAGDRIFTSQALVPGDNILTFPISSLQTVGDVNTRWRFSSTGGLSYTGFGGRGEVEDHRFAITNHFDFGDAPQIYPVTLSVDGARHYLSQLRLGANWDEETDGQPSALADRDDLTGVPDDEDGVLLPAVWAQTTTVNITVNVTGAGGLLDAWIDWDQNGVWDPVERVLAGAPVVAGANLLNITVPSPIPNGFTFARFRLSTLGSALPTGAAADGEVEDYRIQIVPAPAPADLRVALQAAPAQTYSGSNVVISATVTNDGPGTASGMMMALLLPGFTPMQTGTSLGTLTSTGDGLTLTVDSLPAGAGARVVAVGTYDAGTAESMLATNKAGVTSTSTDTNLANNTALAIVAVGRLLDFGDAPASYGTLLPAGARHARRAGLQLGANWDNETNGLPTVPANGDDLNGLADEDGLIGIAPAFTVGRTSVVQVAVQGTGLLNLWVDWNNNGVFDHPAERALGNVPVVGSLTNFPIVVPTGIPAGFAYLRFRLSTSSNLPPTGFANDGEVEDYRVQVLAPVPGAAVLAVSATPNPAEEQQPVVIKLTVGNNGPGDLDNPSVTNALPSGFTLTGLGGSQGNWQTGPAGLVMFQPGAVAAGASASLSITGYFGAGSFRLSDETSVTNRAMLVHGGAIQFSNLVVALFTRVDFGDAPDAPYPTLRASGGARSRLSALLLGAVIDREPDGLPSPNADRDDLTGGVDDEDGVVFLNPFFRGGLVNVNVTASGAGFLDAWFDFDQNGVWDAPEQVFVSVPVVAGVNALVINVPAAIPVGRTYARFRLSSTGGLAVTGYARDGEVEDYAVQIRAQNQNPDLRAERANGSTRLAWDRADGVVEYADSLNGPWTELKGATSPFEVPAGLGEKYFRLRVSNGQSDFASMARRADLVFDGVVTAIEYRSSDVDAGHPKSIPHTFVTFQVDDVLKGRVEGGTITLRFAGGPGANGKVLHVGHGTHFGVGERSLLFVRRNGEIATPLVGQGQGRFRFVNNESFAEDGRELLWTKDARVAYGHHRPLGEVAQYRVGAESFGRVVADEAGEGGEAVPPAGQVLTPTRFKALVRELIQRSHTAQELANPATARSVSHTQPFFVRPPATRAAGSPGGAGQTGQAKALIDDETARVNANGGNPVLK